MLGLTWGGGRFAWSSPEVLAPLIIGLVGLGLSLIYEIKVATHPTIPRVILANRGSQLGYLLSFIHGVVSLSITFYALSWTDPQIGHRRPTWFQSVRAATPIQSGLYFLPMVATISPFAVIEGLIVAKFGHYRLVVRELGWMGGLPSRRWPLHRPPSDDIIGTYCLVSAHSRRRYGSALCNDVRSPGSAPSFRKRLRFESADICADLLSELGHRHRRLRHPEQTAQHPPRVGDPAIPLRPGVRRHPRDPPHARGAEGAGPRRVCGEHAPRVDYPGVALCRWAFDNCVPHRRHPVESACGQEMGACGETAGGGDGDGGRPSETRG